MKKKQYDDDDGRTIADMSMAERPSYGIRAPEGVPDESKKSRMQQEDTAPPLSKKETRGIMFAALKAGLLIGLIFVAGAALLILFCIYVWFK